MMSLNKYKIDKNLEISQIHHKRKVYGSILKTGLILQTGLILKTVFRKKIRQFERFSTFDFLINKLFLYNFSQLKIFYGLPLIVQTNKNDTNKNGTLHILFFLKAMRDYAKILHSRNWIKCGNISKFEKRKFEKNGINMSETYIC